MFECEFNVVSCRRLKSKEDGKPGLVILTTEDVDNPELRYRDFGEMFSGLIDCPFGTKIVCTMYHTIDFKSGQRISRINDYEIIK